MYLTVCKGKSGIISEGIKRDLWVADKADTGIHRVLLVVANDIPTNLAFRIGSDFGTLVGQMTVEDHRIPAHRIQVYMWLLISPTLERIVPIVPVPEMFAKFFRDRAMTEVFDESKTGPLRRVIG